MGKRHGRRATALTAYAAAAAFALAGCGGGGDDSKAGDGTPSASGTASAQDPGGGSDTPSATPTPVLAQIKGEPSMVVTINSAVRDQDGYVTVEGEITNDGTSAFDAVAWRGQEVALSKSGASVAGAYLVDEAGKKRYYVLRDTDGRCLCTMGLVGIQPQETRPFFAQFPAPPAATTQVEFELPTMPPAKIMLSEG